MEQIFRKLKQKNVTFNHVCEAGVYTAAYSNVIDFINQGIRTTLIEADPETVEGLRKHFQEQKNVTIHATAIWDYNGTIKLSKAKASTFVSSLNSSPALANDHYIVSDENSFEMVCCVFSKIDDGTIDLLSVDIEGSEWYLLKHLISKPKIISIETHGRNYTNPFQQNILDWALKHNYSIWYKNVSDTVFVRNDVFKVSATEKFSLIITELGIAMQNLKRSLFK